MAEKQRADEWIVAKGFNLPPKDTAYEPGGKPISGRVLGKYTAELLRMGAVTPHNDDARALADKFQGD